MRNKIEPLLKAQYDNMDCAVGGIADHVMIFVTDATGKDEKKSLPKPQVKNNDLVILRTR